MSLIFGAAQQGLINLESSADMDNYTADCTSCFVYRRSIVNLGDSPSAHRVFPSPAFHKFDDVLLCLACASPVPPEPGKAQAKARRGTGRT